jgi:KipI family sensor histidine kinase inhibitor
MFGQWAVLQLMNVKLQAYGERAVFIQEIGEHVQLQLLEASAADPPQGFVECVVGYSNVLFIFEDPEGAGGLASWLTGLGEANQADLGESRLVEVPVIYDGEDLREVARLSGMCIEAVIALHCAPVYRVRMMGFSPGFPYCDGLDPRLHLERRASPRNHIAPGAVAIGGPHAGIYSVASPGGWHLLGSTKLPLFQPQLAKKEPIVSRSVFALAPGDRVKFIRLS